MVTWPFWYFKTVYKVLYKVIFVLLLLYLGSKTRDGSVEIRKKTRTARAMLAVKNSSNEIESNGNNLPQSMHL